MTVGERIKAILKFKKMTQREFAIQLNMGEVKVSRIVNDLVKISANDIELIANTLGISFYALIGTYPIFDDLLKQVEGRLV